MNGIGDAIASAFFAIIICCVLVTAAVTAGLIFGLPALWHWVKPLLHTLTA